MRLGKGIPVVCILSLLASAFLPVRGGAWPGASSGRDRDGSQTEAITAASGQTAPLGLLSRGFRISLGQSHAACWLPAGGDPPDVAALGHRGHPLTAEGAAGAARCGSTLLSIHCLLTV